MQQTFLRQLFTINMIFFTISCAIDRNGASNTNAVAIYPGKNDFRLIFSPDMDSICMSKCNFNPGHIFDLRERYKFCDNRGAQVKMSAIHLSNVEAQKLRSLLRDNTIIVDYIPKELKKRAAEISLYGIADLDEKFERQDLTEECNAQLFLLKASPTENAEVTLTAFDSKSLVALNSDPSQKICSSRYSSKWSSKIFIRHNHAEALQACFEYATEKYKNSCYTFECFQPVELVNAPKNYTFVAKDKLNFPEEFNIAYKAADGSLRTPLGHYAVSTFNSKSP